MENRILIETLRILNRGNTAPPAVAEVQLNRYFTTIRLENGDVGSVMSHYTGSDKCLEEWACRLQNWFNTNSLIQLKNSAQFDNALAIGNAGGKLVSSAVLGAYVSALSRDTLLKGNGGTFHKSDRIPAGYYKGIATALVVGFGGLLETLVRQAEIQNVHVVDLSYAKRVHIIEGALDVYREEYPGKQLSASAAVDDSQDFDLVSITGSTLSNDTIETFLWRNARGSKIIVQGQSASIIPDVLFRNGVGVVMTTIKPHWLASLGRDCLSGDSMRAPLEGGLPWIYLSPRP